MLVEYFRKKQLILQNETSLDFIRTDYWKDIISEERLVGLIGHRGAGKTTILLQYLKSEYDIMDSLYFSADDIMMSEATIYDIADQFHSLNGKIIIIDEIHKYKNWSRELKNIYDSFPKLKIRFSGSSMLNILHEQYDLSRRAFIIKMNELSFREFLEFKYKIVLEKYQLENLLNNSVRIASELLLKHPYIYAEFNEYLKIGGYPYFIESPKNFSTKLFNSIQKIIYEDIPSLNKIEYSHLSFFQKLIYRVVSSKVPYKVNISQLSREIGISMPTIYTYMEILDKTGIFSSIRKYSAKVSKKPDKLYFRNTNILYAFSNEFGFEINSGTYRETFFVNCFEGDIHYSDIGDFIIKNYIFEIGGKNKDFNQIKDVENSYLVLDTDITINPRKIPLWLFGFVK